MFIACTADGGIGLVDDAGSTYSDMTTVVSERYPGHGQSKFCWRCFCKHFSALHEEMLAVYPNSERMPVSSILLANPVVSPSKIVAASANSVSHVKEMQDRSPKAPPTSWLNDFDVFLKAPSSMIGPGADVLLPPAVVARGAEVHHEVELAVVMSHGGFRLTPEEARGAILGYTIALDVTERGLGDRSRRKSYDTFTPVGPWILPDADVADPNDLAITMSIDGRTVQETSTAELIHNVESIVCYASERMTLEPGDLILTGAGPGTGPIQAGQRLSAYIQSIGTLELGVQIDER
ncbi:MAG: hypothetical protein JWQ68_2339 [Cryobacterium sp.]|jgi:2-keto-4-pentenoate hydratase/2-oxohepta-3-ene-1,7-dioic acid hydratase in catechol pathway|nr:hypothetical protein [Cryobacterium sp.]